MFLQLHEKNILPSARLTRSPEAKWPFEPSLTEASVPKTS